MTGTALEEQRLGAVEAGLVDQLSGRWSSGEVVGTAMAVELR